MHATISTMRTYVMQCMHTGIYLQCAHMLCNACTQAYSAFKRTEFQCTYFGVCIAEFSVCIAQHQKLGTLLPNAFQVELQTSVPAFHSTKYASQMHVVSGTKPSYNYRPGTLPVLPQCHLWGRAMCLRHVLQPTGSSH
jgi:hypothetical protein